MSGKQRKQERRLRQQRETANPPMASSPVPRPPLLQSQAQQTTLQISAERHVGPFPHPSLLAAYEQVLPGAAERIIQFAEREQAHRHKADDEAVQAQVNDIKAGRSEAWYGQLFALCIGLAALTAGAYTAVNGAPLAGGFIGGSGVVGLVTAFIYGRHAASKGEKPPVAERTQEAATKAASK